jgi:hypothetical protein
VKTLFPGQPVEPATCSGQPGTISFFGHKTADASSKVLVTCDHVIHGSDKEKISSPTSGCCPSCCPSNVVGVGIDGMQGPHTGLFVDAASAQLLLAEAAGSNRIAGFAGKNKAGKAVGGAIVGTAKAKPGEKVNVFGAKSGRMEGMVILPTANGQPLFADRLVVEVDPQFAIDVATGTGDSGAPILNLFNELIGIMSERAVLDPNSLGEQSRIILGCHIAPVLSRLQVTFDPAPVPAAGPLVAPPVAPAEPAEPPWLAEIRDAVRASAAGSMIFDAGSRHAREVVHLVNHCRPVTVAWHRHKGPAWSAHLIRSWRDPGYLVPDEVNGVTRLQLLAQMRVVLSRHGSHALAADLARDGDAVLALAGLARIRDVLAPTALARIEAALSV